MEQERNGPIVCSLCNETKTQREMTVSSLVTGIMTDEIHKTKPDWSSKDPICLSCFNQLNSKFIQHVLEAEKGELSGLEIEVANSLKENELLSRNINTEFDQRLTLGEKASDRMASFAGSWVFIGIFSGVIFTWLLVNSIALFVRPFDPFPFILLNLVLSCVAAIQAPVIMMSQNRQGKKDRLQADHDYRINLKAELEIRLLHAKMDQLLTHHWQRLLEIQQIQTELMEEVIRQGAERK